MFIVVRFGDNKSELFNPNCKNHILLDNIKQRCCCEDEDKIDLSDETGTVIHLSQHPYDYGKSYLAERGSFILVKLEKETIENGEVKEERTFYVPDLQDKKNDAAYLARLNPRPKSKLIKPKRNVEKSESPRTRASFGRRRNSLFRNLAHAATGRR
ncbi:uncharacterized protein CXorf65-like [Anneissia japonica]|uniref:uncharacterized protein CXorf65-like n=1 Tax=Anneissia japonica TaxID=1529436 RepID=UPI0014259CBB|nr:uncharacterized protein CXorf65-like [Anneissia japonica]